jgi:hypothetical protein
MSEQDIAALVQTLLYFMKGQDPVPSQEEIIAVYQQLQTKHPGWEAPLPQTVLP